MMVRLPLFFYGKKEDHLRGPLLSILPHQVPDTLPCPCQSHADAFRLDLKFFGNFLGRLVQDVFGLDGSFKIISFSI